MDLSSDEELILDCIKDGNSNSRQLFFTTGLKSVKIKEILLSLKNKGFITIAKKFDSTYNEEGWEVSLT